jgi:hypothetical protein
MHSSLIAARLVTSSTILISYLESAESEGLNMLGANAKGVFNGLAG